LFLLLLVLNAFYLVWNRQQAPLLPKEVAPISVAGARQDVQLLSDSARTPMPAVAPDRAEDVCMFLGSFSEPAAAAVLEQRLLSLDVQSDVQAFEASGSVDFWVYLAPLASRQASLRQLRELQARRIDSYIITEGELANGISLGIFPRHDSAESVMQRLRSAGYEPRLRELARSVSSYWVRILPSSRRLVDEGLLQRLAGDFPGVQHQLMPCQGVATQE
jgi:hypothetical protein